MKADQALAELEHAVEDLQTAMTAKVPQPILEGVLAEVDGITRRLAVLTRGVDYAANAAARAAQKAEMKRSHAAAKENRRRGVRYVNLAPEHRGHLAKRLENGTAHRPYQPTKKEQVNDIDD